VNHENIFISFFLLSLLGKIKCRPLWTYFMHTQFFFIITHKMWENLIWGWRCDVMWVHTLKKQWKTELKWKINQIYMRNESVPSWERMEWSWVYGTYIHFVMPKARAFTITAIANDDWKNTLI
jgi:hypothetical protein